MDILALYEKSRLFPTAISSYERQFLQEKAQAAAAEGSQPSKPFTFKQQKLAEEIEAKLEAAKSKAAAPGFCGDCSTGWLPYRYIPDGQVVALRCECQGGPQAVAAYLRSKGDIDLAQRVMQTAWEIKHSNDYIDARPDLQAAQKAIDQIPF